MQDKHLHIISFNIPFPANYGGVIDVYYKIKALHNAGIKVHLHCFEYGRKIPDELKEICFDINYYKRKTGLISSFSIKPYIVKSRISEDLIKNICNDNYPVLFEGLHSCYYIDDKRIANKIKIYRESNIEHHYYYHLFKAEKNFLKKLYFITESIKLKLFQNKLKNADLMLVVSENDTLYLQKEFPENKVVYLPSFHPNNEIEISKGIGKYVLYHGNLSVAENEEAAIYLIENVFDSFELPFIIAGLNPGNKLKNLVKKYKHISLIANPEENIMNKLISEAQVNILLTFQETGLKLKLLNTLYKGRYCIVNSKMLAGTNLNELCIIADNKYDIKENLIKVFNNEFDYKVIKLRKEILDKKFSNQSNLKNLLNLIFEEK